MPEVPMVPVTPGFGGLTRPRASPHNLFMNDTNTTKTQLDLELARLEKRIEELLASIDSLKEENRALRQRHETLNNDRAGLLQKNEQVRARVEAMIGRLKTMEHGA